YRTHRHLTCCMQEIREYQPRDVGLLSARHDQSGEVHHNKTKRKGNETQSNLYRHGWIQVARCESYPQAGKQWRQANDEHRTERLQRARAQFSSEHSAFGLIARETSDR